MIIKPINRRVGDALAMTVVAITAPLWAVPLGLLFVVVWTDNKIVAAIRPGPEWEPWFAWRPVSISAWTGDDDFTGLVWLETVYRRYRPMCGLELRRSLPEEPTP